MWQTKAEEFLKEMISLVESIVKSKKK